MERSSKSTICLVVAVAALLPYVLLPGQDVIYDGQLAITANEAVQSGPLTGLWAVDFWGESTRADHSTRSWRPLVSLGWALQSRLHGPSPAAYHVVDMVLHACASALVVLLLSAWGIDRRWLLPAGLLFALHPVQTDSVASLVGRADVMAAICLFGALVLQARASRRERPWMLRAGALGLLAAALMCKEYAVVFPFILIATDLVRRAAGTTTDCDRRGQLRTWLCSLALLAAYLLTRVLLFGDLGGAPATAGFHPLADEPWPVRWATSLALVPLALRLAIAPVALNHHYRFGTLSIPEGLLDPRALWGFLLVAFLVAAAAWLWQRRRETPPALALLLVLLPLAPSLHAVSVTGVLFAERFLYIPVAGLVLAVAWALQKWAVSPAARKAAGAALAFVIVLFGGMTFARVGDWASMERLARSSIASYPNGSDVWKQLGLALVLDARHGEAVTALARAVEINPRDAQAWMVYADALKGTRRYDEAFEALEKVIELAPAEPGVILREAGQLQLLAGRAEQAVAPLVRAHELMPADARSLYYLVQAYLRSGEPEAAVTALLDGERAVQTDPESLRPLLGQAMLRTAQQRLDDGRNEEALSWTRQATQFTDLPPPGLFLGGMIARKAGDEELASWLFEAALSRDPELLRTKHDTAVRLVEEGTFDEAIALLEEVLAVEPEHAPSLFNLGRALLLSGRPAEAIGPLERGLRQMEDERARSLLEQARAEAG